MARRWRARGISRIWQSNKISPVVVEYRARQRQMAGVRAMTSGLAMVDGRDRENGRFKTGNNGGGRPRGSRNKLGEQFLNDLVSSWDRHGVAALETCAKSEPVQFCKLVAGVLPREILVSALTTNVNIDLGQIESARGFFAAFKYAREKIGVEPPATDQSAEAEVAWKMDHPDDD